MSDSLRLSLVIPLYNEELVARNVAESILDAFCQAGEPLELVLVDNGSSDGTGRLIAALQADHAAVTSVRVEVNCGYGWGVLSGLSAASGTHVGWMGGDGQIAAQDVVRVWQEARQHPDSLSKARRIVRHDGPTRYLVTLLCNSLFSLLFPVRTDDINGTPKVMPRTLYQALELKSKDWFLDAEVMIKCGRRRISLQEVPVTFLSRAGGTSHVRFSAIVEFLGNIWRTLFGGGT